MWNSFLIYVLIKIFNIKNSSDKEIVKYGYFYKKFCQVVEGICYDSCIVCFQLVNFDIFDYRNCWNILVFEMELLE